MTAIRAVCAVCAAVAVMIAIPAPATAEPDPAAPDTVQAVAATGPGAPPAEAAAPAEPGADDGTVPSSPPQSTTSPDGWTLTVSSKDETRVPVAPLTTAISTREYAVGGVFNGSLKGGDGETPKGVFEVGYQIGCGIDMTTSNGVSMTGTAGITPTIGYFGLDFAQVAADGIIPSIGANFGGALTVGLKPGLINVVPVTKKEYKGSAPWVSISNFRVKIDGCVGQSFIRSYATLTKSTEQGDAVLSWYGETKAV